MLFSIVIPTYNRKKEILSCLESISHIDFDKKDYEVVVVDDGSNDGTQDITDFENVRFLKLPTRCGPSYARNFGVKHAYGQYVCFIDSDCEVPKNLLIEFRKAYENFPNVCGVGGNIVNDGTGIFEKYETLSYKKYISKKESYVSNKRDEFPFALGNMSYRKDLLIKYGGFSESYPYNISGEDAMLKEKFQNKNCILIYVPVTVIHKKRYNFKTFIKQMQERGAGMLYDSKRNGKIQSKLSIYMRLLLLLPYFIYISLANFSIVYGFTDTLAFVFKNIGKLKYYRVVKYL